ncbi:MAG: glycosyltransferase [Nitrososphaeraceae archaeon]
MPKNSDLVIILCAKNCEMTIKNVITNIKKSSFNPDVIVVDGFSTDNTVDLSQKIDGVKIIQQSVKKFPGKGIAMKDGLNEVIKNKDKNYYKAILFLDSDIKNINSSWVDDLVRPVLERGTDMTRGFYERHPRDAAVTKIVAKPMLQIFFPELSQFEQPLSGEVCASIHVWETLLRCTPPDGWGIDVWFLIETALSGYKIEEIYLGNKDHSSFDAYMEDVGKLNKMSEQVLFTIIKQAIKYKRFELYNDVHV